MADKTENQQRRGTGRQWPKGVSGNPAGRKQGSRNKATVALQSILEGEGEAITRRAVKMALAGDTTALRLCIERLIPPVKERRLNLDLPQVVTAADVTKSIGAVLDAVARGELTAAEGQAVAGLLEVHRKAIETQELEDRISALERRHETGNTN